MHPINILTLNRRISFINVGKYKKEYRKAMELSCLLYTSDAADEL